MAATQFASSYPTLHPGMVMPWTSRRAPAFPMDTAGLRYYYLARNAIHALAEVWNLRDQEVLFPAYFHGVELETLLAAGVKLKFYPVDANMQVDAGVVASMITPRTRAVYLIHYLGFPGPAAELSRICRQRGLPLIEDCALALLSRSEGKPLGSFGDASIFCLYKTLPVPNGGALWMRNPKVERPWPEITPPTLTSTMAYTATAVYRHLRFNGGGVLHTLMQKARNSARSMSDQLGVVPVGDNHLDPAKVGLGMSGMCHWILARQDYEGIVERRRRNYSHLLDRLRRVSNPVFTELPEGVCPLFFPIRTQNKMAVLRRLLDMGVEAVNFWSKTPDIVPKRAFPEVDALRNTILELPCHQDLTLEAADWIADRIHELRTEL
ncbi:MAG: DegT/DnrJ/EryC1/StrS family aminotransferase [Bryobacteraceae bacterium]|nr:DegT/DnrJ/EryC1/StrS family aminotransferase [Bryobacteraceae bacterium]